MSVPDTKTLQLLLERTREQRDAALQAARGAQVTAARQAQQATQLQDYRREYQQRWSLQFGREGRAEIVQCYRSFMQRLDEAVQQQDELATRADAMAVLAQQGLQALERRVAAVERLIERRLDDHQVVQQRREQRHADDAAQRALALSPGSPLRLAAR